MLKCLPINLIYNLGFLKWNKMICLNCDFFQTRKILKNKNARKNNKSKILYFPKAIRMMLPNSEFASSSFFLTFTYNFYKQLCIFIFILFLNHIDNMYINIIVALTDVYIDVISNDGYHSLSLNILKEGFYYHWNLSLYNTHARVIYNS